MKNKTKKRQYSHSSKSKGASDPQVDLEAIATELVALARARLPDNVLRGVLRGQEDDIRQDAVLLALRWYTNQQEGVGVMLKQEWCAPRAIAAALGYKKLEYARMAHEAIAAIEAMGAGAHDSILHPAASRDGEWTPETMKSVLNQAIKICLRRGIISHANAIIAMMVYVDGLSVAEVANKRGVSRGAVYQQLARVRSQIPDVIDGIEIPLFSMN